MTWEELLTKNNVVGGRLWTFENGDVYRSTITDATLNCDEDEGDISFGHKDLQLWHAVKEEGLNPPPNIPPSRVGGDIKHCRPEVADAGHISFDIPYMGTGVVIPKGVEEPKDARDFLDNFVR